jgi:hypothetical protein
MLHSLFGPFVTQHTISGTGEEGDFCLIPVYLQAVQIYVENCVKLREALRGVLSSTPPYRIGLRPRVSVGNETY